LKKTSRSAITQATERIELLRKFVEGDGFEPRRERQPARL
jgi:hypothetical protein